MLIRPLCLTHPSVSLVLLLRRRLQGMSSSCPTKTETSSPPNPTAAALIIGDEILNGSVRDTNTWILAKHLYTRGVDLRRVVTIADDVETIAESVQQLSAGYDFVFTSGGIGSTHDDMTYQGVAQAFRRTLVYHEPTLDAMRRWYAVEDGETEGDPLNEYRMRMALVPADCEILKMEDLWIPLVVVQNVYVLPGVPSLFSKMLHLIDTRLCGKRYAKRTVYTKIGESKIADVLDQAAHHYKGRVKIGSYPNFTHALYETRITFEGSDPKVVDFLTENIREKVEGFFDENLDRELDNEGS